MSLHRFLKCKSERRRFQPEAGARIEGAFSVIVKLQTSRMLVSSTGWLQYYSIGHGETEVLSVALRDIGDGGME